MAHENRYPSFGGSVQRKGVFTISMDCEGLWGMADQSDVFTHKRITSSSLGDCYSFLTRTLDAAEVRPTAAFVSAFSAERQALRSQLHRIEQLARLCPGWFAHLLPRLREGTDTSLDGLEGHAFWRALRSGGHEIGWHGATHIALNGRTSTEALEIELAIARELFQASGERPTSVVFPRNLAGHLARLRECGFDTYRAARGSGTTERLGGLLREWSLWDRGDKAHPMRADHWNVSPAGFFLNWPSGARAAIPSPVTVQRWRSILRTAAAEGRYVHMWFHPHNLITAPRMRATFAEVIREAAALVRSGDLLNLTMSEANTEYGLQ